jgi:hypothetical protein
MQRGALQSYQHMLGAIGRYLDQHSYEDILLCELGDGFVGRVLQGGRLLAAIPFQASDLTGMVRAAAEETSRAQTIVPQPGLRRGSFLVRALGSYRYFLDALGGQLDRAEATSILVAELSDSVLVVYRRAVGPHDSGAAAASEYIYDECGVRKLMAGEVVSRGK